jgi:hypothetical protein
VRQTPENPQFSNSHLRRRFSERAIISFPVLYHPAAQGQAKYCPQKQSIAKEEVVNKIQGAGIALVVISYQGAL